MKNKYQELKTVKYSSTLPALNILVTALNALPVKNGECPIKEQLFFIAKQVFQKEKVTFIEKKEPVTETQSKYSITYQDRTYSFLYTSKPRVHKPKKHTDPVATFLSRLMIFYNRESKHSDGVKRVFLKYKSFYSEEEDVRASTKSYSIFTDNKGKEYEIRYTNIWKVNKIRFTADTEIEMDICNTNPSYEAFRITFDGKTWIRSGNKIISMSKEKSLNDYDTILTVIKNFVDEACILK